MAIIMYFIPPPLVCWTVEPCNRKSLHWWVWSEGILSAGIAETEKKNPKKTECKKEKSKFLMECIIKRVVSLHLCKDGRVWKNWTKGRNVLSGCDRHLWGKKFCNGQHLRIKIIDWTCTRTFSKNIALEKILYTHLNDMMEFRCWSGFHGQGRGHSSPRACRLRPPTFAKSRSCFSCRGGGGRGQHPIQPCRLAIGRHSGPYVCRGRRGKTVPFTW